MSLDILDMIKHARLIFLETCFHDKQTIDGKGAETYFIFRGCGNFFGVCLCSTKRNSLREYIRRLIGLFVCVCLSVMNFFDGGKRENDKWFTSRRKQESTRTHPYAHA